MIDYAYGLDTVGKKASDYPKLAIYNDFYGLTVKDLGLYALVENKIAGAIWSRKLNKEHNSNAFVNETTPVLSIAVLPEFRGQGIGSSMMTQFLLEAGALYEQLSVVANLDSQSRSFYEKFGFTDDSSKVKSEVSDKEMALLLKELTKKEVVRPTDGYDPRRWMD